ncbi:hypothetical protein, partial [Mycobacterium sp. RTGN5]|uniref:hypothetical protein n=1 Tax=Mycobacterium sp. RTGN5 TaxID=3016522 RepID=UPI0029C86F14
ARIKLSKQKQPMTSTGEFESEQSDLTKRHQTNWHQKRSPHPNTGVSKHGKKQQQTIKPPNTLLSSQTTQPG